MKDLKTKINELKTMQTTPEYFLYKYFDALKLEVDLKFASIKEDREKEDYIEIIDAIKAFEQERYNNIKQLNDFDEQIMSLETQLNELDNLDVNLMDVDYKRWMLFFSIDKIKYKIERKLFSNKSILFINDYNKEKKSFLIIITGEYFRRSILNKFIEYDYENNIDDLDCGLLNYYISNNNKRMKIKVTREQIFGSFLNKILLKKKNEINNLFNININEVLKKTKINFRFKKTKAIILFTIIDSDILTGFKYLNSIVFREIHIKELDSDNIFRGLINLEIIDFSNNRIEKIHKDMFNGLINLKNINFSYNCIKDIDPATFSGLKNLKEINFASNYLEVIHPATFIDLINFDYNNIEKLDKDVFKGLNNMKKINFNSFSIKDPTALNGLINLKEINFRSNSLQVIHPATFIGLTNLEIINFDFNKIEYLMI
jgi:hypothetical protein